MTIIWVLLTIIAILLIYIGDKVSRKNNQLGTLMIIVGLFQLLGEVVALL